MRWPAWRAVLKRVWDESWADNISLCAAGVAFYGFLSLVPAIGAVTLTYGLFASPDLLIDTIVAVAKRLPASAATIVNDQIVSLVRAPTSSKGLGLIGAMSIALYGATSGVDALMTAVAIAYDQEERRSFFKRTGIVIGLTIFTVLFTLVTLGAVSLLNLPNSLRPRWPVELQWVVSIASAALLTIAGMFAAGIFYRFGPDRQPARWQWLTPGALLSGLLWLAVTSAFAFYVGKINDYGATWGSLAGIVVLLTWLYLSAYALLIGAELNAELEHQTARDSTTGPERPLGQRGAYVADHVAGAGAAE